MRLFLEDVVKASGTTLDEEWDEVAEEELPAPIPNKLFSESVGSRSAPPCFSFGFGVRRNTPTKTIHTPRRKKQDCIGENFRNSWKKTPPWRMAQVVQNTCSRGMMINPSNIFKAIFMRYNQKESPHTKFKITKYTKN